ncbi:MAG: hypothetical protein SO162_06065, partial [Candidatus Onthomorpha sp.]|nr:hypothetical protein [Candidatus Onthomorpha sp.]
EGRCVVPSALHGDVSLVLQKTTTCKRKQQELQSILPCNSFNQTMFNRFIALPCRKQLFMLSPENNDKKDER